MYPYKSNLKTKLQALHEGRDYVVWRGDIPKILAGPIVEIGGPTETGYYFLDGLDLGSKPIITNISKNPLPYAPNAKQLSEQVDELMDATKMKYPDKSVGAFLMAGMSLSSDWWVGLDDPQKQEAEPQFNKEFDIARLEMAQVAAGILSPDKVVHAQRVKIYLETYRALRKGGLLFTDGGTEEIAILKTIGFKLCALLCLPEENGVACEFVVAKP